MPDLTEQLDLDKLEALRTDAVGFEGEWRCGIAGYCDLVAYNGEDITGIAEVKNHKRAKYIAALHNSAPALFALARKGMTLDRYVKQIEQLPMRPSLSEERIAEIARDLRQRLFRTGEYRSAPVPFNPEALCAEAIRAALKEAGHE